MSIISRSLSLLAKFFRNKSQQQSQTSIHAREKEIQITPNDSCSDFLYLHPKREKVGRDEQSMKANTKCDVLDQSHTLSLNTLHLTSKQRLKNNFSKKNTLDSFKDLTGKESMRGKKINHVVNPEQSVSSSSNYQYSEHVKRLPKLDCEFLHVSIFENKSLMQTPSFRLLNEEKDISSLGESVNLELRQEFNNNYIYEPSTNIIFDENLYEQEFKEEEIIIENYEPSSEDNENCNRDYRIKRSKTEKHKETIIRKKTKRISITSDKGV